MCVLTWYRLNTGIILILLLLLLQEPCWARLYLSQAEHHTLSRLFSRYHLLPQIHAHINSSKPISYRLFLNIFDQQFQVHLHEDNSLFSPHLEITKDSKLIPPSNSVFNVLHSRVFSKFYSGEVGDRGDAVGYGFIKDQWPKTTANPRNHEFVESEVTFFGAIHDPLAKKSFYIEPLWLYLNHSSPMTYNNWMVAYTDSDIIQSSGKYANGAGSGNGSPGSGGSTNTFTSHHRVPHRLERELIRVKRYRRSAVSGDGVRTERVCSLNLVADRSFYMSFQENGITDTNDALVMAAQVMVHYANTADYLLSSLGLSTDVRFNIWHLTYLQHLPLSFVGTNIFASHPVLLEDLTDLFSQHLDTSGYCLALVFTSRPHVPRGVAPPSGRAVPEQDGTHHLPTAGACATRHTFKSGGHNSHNPEKNIDVHYATYNNIVLNVREAVSGSTMADFLKRIKQSFGCGPPWNNRNVTCGDTGNSDQSTVMQEFAHVKRCCGEKITEFMENQGWCLIQNTYNITRQVKEASLCGNMVIDDGEECDCGDAAEVCNHVDPCCSPGQCRLKPGAACTYQHDACCNASCQIIPKQEEWLCAEEGPCHYAAHCSGASASCPAPVFKHNGAACDASGQMVCYHGSCGQYQCEVAESSRCDCDDPMAGEAREYALNHTSHLKRFHQLCHLCCRLPSGRCEPASYLLALMFPSHRPSLLLRPVGSPCNSGQGVCDPNHICVLLDPREAYEKVWHDTDASAYWFSDHWYSLAVLVFALSALALLASFYSHIRNRFATRMRLREMRLARQQNRLEERRRVAKRIAEKMAAKGSAGSGDNTGKDDTSGSGSNIREQGIENEAATKESDIANERKKTEEERVSHAVDKERETRF